MPEGYNVGNFQPYKSMYVDQKRPEIAKIKRDRYDASKAEYDALNRAVGSVQTLGGDEYTVNRLKDRITDRMGSVISSGAYENANFAVSDAVTDFASDKSVAQAAESMENYKKGEALKAEMKAKGMQIYDFDKMVVGTNPDGTPIWGSAADTHVTETGGVYQPKFEEKLDTSARVKMLMDGIAEDGGALRSVAATAGVTEAEAKMFLKYGEGISDDKIARIAKALTPLYADSQEGRQKFRALTQLELQDEKTAMNALEQDLYSYGKKQVGWKNKYIENPYAKLLAEQETPPPPYIPTTVPSFEVNPESMQAFGWSQNKGMFTNGMLNTDITIDQATPPATNNPLAGQTYSHSQVKISNSAALTRYKKDLATANGDMMKVPMVGSAPLGRLMYLKEKYGHLKGKNESDEKFLERVNAGIISSHAQIGQVHPYSPDGRRGYADLALGNISNLRIVDMEEGGDKTPKTTAAWSKATSSLSDDKWGWTGDPYYANQLEIALSNESAGKAHSDDESWVEIHGINVSGNQPGATEMVLHTPRGTKKMQVSYSDQTKNFFTGVANMAKLIQSPDENRVENVSLPGMPPGVSHYKMKGSYENQADGSIQFAPMVKRVFVPTPSNPNGSEDDQWYPMPPNKINEMVQSTVQAFQGNFNTFEGQLMQPQKVTRSSVTQ